MGLGRSSTSRPNNSPSLPVIPAKVSELQIPVEASEYAWSNVVGNLGDVVNGDTHGRTSVDEVTLFKSVGLGIQDISCAALVCREAMANGIGQEFDFSG